MNVGSIVVVRASAPARFKNLKPGTLWKVVKADIYGNFAVGDQFHKAIRTLPEYFVELDEVTLESIGTSGNTDLNVRLNALYNFRPDLCTYTVPAGYVKVDVNGTAVLVARAAACHLKQHNPHKLVQRKLIQALGGL